MTNSHVNMAIPKALPLSKQIYYAIGQLGWSLLINIVNLQLVYFYIPPNDSGIPIFISQIVLLGVLNIITLLAASGRLFDAITDPLIANWSDNSTHPKGRRLPMMLKGILPAILFCTLMFFPITDGQSSLNILWLFITQVLFYFFLTVYVTPYFALIPEFGHTPKARLNLSTWISITYALGIAVAAQAPGLADVILASIQGITEVQSLQYAIGLICAVAGLFMLVPILTINEKEYAKTNQTKTNVKDSLRHTFANKHFRYYVVADFAYFMGLTIIMTGLLYFITVLLQLEESFMGLLLPLMVLVSFVFYPIVNVLARLYGKKPLVYSAFFFMALIFLLSSQMGRLPMSSESQAYLIVFLYAIPIAFLGILPNAILSDIADQDAKLTGVNQEGMFFAARTLMQKFGQTFGVFVFAMLTTLGKDVGDDFGIRMSAVVGAVLCFFSGFYFMKYNEKEVIGERER